MAGDGEESMGERTPQFRRHRGMREERCRQGRKSRREKNIFIVWELVVKISDMVDKKIPSQQWRRFYDITSIKQQKR